MEPSEVRGHEGCLGHRLKEPGVWQNRADRRLSDVSRKNGHVWVSEATDSSSSPPDGRWVMCIIDNDRSPGRW